jgi:hypothetical protein
MRVGESAPPSHGIPRYFYVAVLIAVIAFFAGVRFHLRALPMDRDEGEFAYAGQLMLQGIPPFQLEYTMKLPGTAAGYAALILFFGESSAGIHTGLILLNAATTILIFLLALRFFDHLAALIAAACYALFSTSPLVLGFSAQATNFVVFFALAGILVLLKAIESDSNWMIFASGLLLGLAFLMKQPGALFCVFAGIYLIRECVTESVGGKKLIARTGVLALGGAIPFVATCLMLFHDGLFQKFWFWTFQYAREYGSGYLEARNMSHGLQRLIGATPLEIAGHAVVLLVFPVALLLTYLWSERARSQAFFTLSFLVFSALAVCPGLYFRRHYFILVLPAVAILIGMMVSCWTEKLRSLRMPGAVVALPTLLFIVAFLGAIFLQRNFLFHLTPLQASRQLYGDSPFAEASEIADYIKNHTNQQASIAVVGSEPEIYFYAHRHSATGYIYMYPFLEPQRYSPVMQQEMISEVETAHPEMLIFAHVQTSWGLPFADIANVRVLGWVRQYAQENYQLDGVVEIGDTTEYHWGATAKDYHPQSSQYVLIYKRKQAS